MPTPSPDCHAQDSSLDSHLIPATVAQHHSAMQRYVEIYDLWAKAGGRRATTLNDYWKILSSFALFLERKEPLEILRKDVIAFRDSLLGSGQSITTVSRKVGVLKTLFRVALDYELLTTNPAAQVRVTGTQQPKARIAFSVEDLNQLFHSPIFTDGYRPNGSGREAVYWLPLLALFTGARVEELAQLLVTDIHHEEGLGHYLSITDDADHAKLKNAASRRRIPLHPTLIDCGFLDYAASVRERRLLFPDLLPNPRGKLGGYFSTFFSKYLRQQVGIIDPRKVFHSFRHTFKDVCRSVGIDEAVHDALTGHTVPSAGRKYGNDQYPLPPLFEAMEQFEIVGLKIDHLLTRPPTHKLVQIDSQMISAYYGVVVALSRVKSHRQLPPYVFARCSDGEAAISIADNQILKGTLPSGKKHLVHAWIEIHREELLANWDVGQQSGEFFRIDPLR